MTVKFTNNASTTVGTGINTSATSLTVASASSFPSLSGADDYCYLTIQQSTGTVREVVKATALSGNTFTIVRAQDNTSAGTWSAGDIVELRMTAALLTDVIDAATVEGVKTNFQYTPTAGQTVFSGADNASNTMIINQAALVSVYLNGIRLVQGSDYSVSSANNTVTLTAGVTTADIVDVEVFGNFTGQSGAAVAITGGAISGASVAATTLSASGTATLNTFVSSNATISGGTINNVNIGGTTAGTVAATTLTANSVAVDNITLDGNEIDVSSGDLTIDVAGDIILDADSGVYRLKDNGASLLQIARDGSSSVHFYSAVSNMNMLFKGNDGGNTITALDLDMENGGRADFANDISVNDGRGLRLGSDDDSIIYNDGSNLYVKNNTSNQDIIFQGNDDGSASLEMLKLDSSNLGAATFSGSVTSAGLTSSGPINLTAGALAAAGNAGLSHRSSDNKVYLQAGTGGFNILDDQQNTHFYIDSAGAATFSGSVGIGTAPATKFDVMTAGANQWYIRNSDSSSQENAIVSLRTGGYSNLNLDGTNVVFKNSGIVKAKVISRGMQVGNISATTGNSTTGTTNFLTFGGQYWTGTKGTQDSLQIRLYDAGSADIYGFGVSSSELEIQSASAIGVYTGQANAKTRVGHISPSGHVTLEQTAADYGLTLQSASSRSGLVIKDESSNVIGSLLGVHSDDSFRVGTSSYYHIEMDQSGNTTLGGGPSSAVIGLNHTVSVVKPTSTHAPKEHAYINIGRSSGNETRAIDIWGSWSSNEHKSITFNHGNSTSNIVGQINCIHYSPGSAIRWGKLYHSGEGTTFTMELRSVSTTGSRLIINNSDVVGDAPINAKASQGGTSCFVGRSHDYTHPMGILAWSGVSYISSGTSYSGSVWDYSQTTDANSGIALIGWNASGGIRWYAGDTSGGGNPNGWGLASNVQLFNSAGQLTASTASDRRLKDNITNLSSSEALAKVNALQAVSFEWNDTIKAKRGGSYPDGTQYGFIAQDVKEVWADAHIISDNDAYEADSATQTMDENDTYYGDIEGVRQEKLIPLLVEAIKELKSENDSLKNRIVALENN